MTDKVEPQATSKLLDRFDTPIFDGLMEKQKLFVLAYCQCFDKEVAYDQAGYKTKIVYDRRESIHKLVHNPKIVAAMDELIEKQMAQIDGSRTALCTRLLYQSLATPYDVCDWAEEYMAGNGVTVKKPALFPKPFKDVEPRFHAAYSFLSRNHDGSYGWDNMAQHRATALLSKMMLWDQEVLDTNAPINFSFGNVQEEVYVKPGTSIELGAVQSDDDEVDRLTH